MPSRCETCRGVGWHGFILTAFLSFASCSTQDEGEGPISPPGISSDQELFAVLTGAEDYRAFALFPRADSVVSGTLNGSNAHQPLVRVSLNNRALSALTDGMLPAQSSFPDSSIVLKQIISQGQPALLAVIFKQTGNPLASGGWLWAEFRLDGSPFISIQSRGSGCVGCHEREAGLRNDRVRTFERQRP